MGHSIRFGRSCQIWLVLESGRPWLIGCMERKLRIASVGIVRVTCVLGLPPFFWWWWSLDDVKASLAKVPCPEEMLSTSFQHPASVGILTLHSSLFLFSFVMCRVKPHSKSWATVSDVQVEGDLVSEVGLTTPGNADFSGITTRVNKKRHEVRYRACGGSYTMTR